MRILIKILDGNKHTYKMKNLKIILLVLLAAMFSSCLTSGLDDLPTFSDAEIINVKFEYRWSVKEGTSDKLRVKMLTTDYVVNAESNEVTCKVTVPNIDANFPDEIRREISLNNIIGYTTISSAAKISPLNNAPILGKPGDWSSPNEYEVTAANGDQKKWTIKVVTFNK